MKRTATRHAVFCAFLVMAGTAAEELHAQPAQGLTSKMLGTRHNLSVLGSGTVRAATEKQMCVFCHTPHVPKEFVGEQLWNHKLSSADYTLYSSDYLTNLNYVAPNQPNLRSKLCLSCHDGTVAIGAVYNNNGPGTISMENQVTTMPAGAEGNLGVSLANDHPVGFVYDVSKDPELVTRTWPWNTAVKLDPDAATGTLECITCHEPHDDQFGKFLRVSNTYSALCTFCHAKTGWPDAIHKTSTQTHIPGGDSTTTVGEAACRNCHKSHGGEGIPYLLPLLEENTCYASGCHGETDVGVNTKKIKSEFQKLYSHPTNSVAGKHRNPDTESSLGAGSRHAECEDCHDSHQARKGLHALQTNQPSNVLKGAGGVIPGSTGIWTQPSTFTLLKPAVKESQICFKCHSGYAFGMVSDGVTAIIGPSGEHATDQAMEFNGENKSAHPVDVPSNNQTGSTLPRALDPAQLTVEWNSAGTQTMYCSDCHGNDQATSQTSPQGPHGSDSRFMLTGRAKYWPSGAFGTLWSLADVRNNLNNWQNDLFCVNCHPISSAGSWENNVHQAAQHQDASIRCITCHVAVPHGSKRSRLVGYETDVQPYNTLGPGPYDKLVIAGFQKAGNRFAYTVDNCSMNGVCHGTRFGTYEP